MVCVIAITCSCIDRLIILVTADFLIMYLISALSAGGDCNQKTKCVSKSFFSKIGIQAFGMVMKCPHQGNILVLNKLHFLLDDDNDT